MTDLWLQLVTNWPILGTIADACFIIVPLSVIMAYTGLYFISATARMIGAARNRNAYEKCSRQLAFLALVLGWLLLVAGRIWLYYNQNEVQGELVSYMYEMSWLLLSLGVLLGTIYYFLWRILKNMPVLHVTLGMLSAVQNCIALAAILFTIRLSAAASHPQGEEYALPNIFPEVWEAPIWSAACYTIPAIFGLAGGFALCWLSMRRKKDDYGRDYYKNMLQWCAAWAKNSWMILLFLLLLASGLKFWRGNLFTDTQSIIYETSGLLLWLIPALCWIIIQKSAVPARNSWLAWISLPMAMTFMLPYFLDITFI